MNPKLPKILIVGIGGLGTPAAWALAEAGAGVLGLMDPDRVEPSNLHRQILYSDKDLGRPKVEAASAFLRERFPGIPLEAVPEALTPSNARETLSRYDFVVDGLDRLEKKFLLNDWCVKLGRPFVHAGVVRFEGQVLAVRPGETACLRCLIPRIPPPFAMPTCQEAGVLGSFSQAIGYLQAHETLRLVREGGTPRLWKVDAQKREVRSIIPARDPQCQACGKGMVEAVSSPASCAV